MHGRAPREVEPAHDEDPPVRVPRPARDRIVNDGGPDENEDEHRTESPALRDGADSENGRDGGKHELIDAEDDGGETC